MYVKKITIKKLFSFISYMLCMTLCLAMLFAVSPAIGAYAAGATYYVSPTGNDLGDGSIGSPFLTIAKAASVMTAGDTCVLREGRYYETVQPPSGASGAHVTFTAYPGETAVVSGADRVMGWTPVAPANVPSGASNVYKANVDLRLGDGDLDDFLLTLNDNDKRLWEYGSEFQIFRDGEIMYEARYPNIQPGDSFAAFTYGLSTAGNYINTPSTRWGFYISPDAGFATLAGNDPDFLEGAWLWGVHGSEWCALTRPVVGYLPPGVTGYGLTAPAAGAIICSPSSTRQWPQNSGSYTPGASRPYYVFGTLNLLDADGEWWYDKAAKELYIVSATSPDALIIEAKQRRNAFDLSGKSYVDIIGINVLASTVITDENSSDILLKDMKCEYVGYNSKTGLEIQGIDDNAAQDNQGVLLKGSFITVDSCEIAYSTGPVINVQGSDNTVFNSYIHDGNSIGCYAGHTKLSGRRQLITHNTFSDSGRDVVSFRQLAQSIVQYNDIYNAGYLTKDLGMMYAANSDGQNTLIHHNVLHDNHALGTNMGLYPDEMTQNYIMYRNIIYNSGQNWKPGVTNTGTALPANQASLYNLIYNNSTYNRATYAGNYAFGNGYHSNVGRQVINNIFNEGLTNTTNSASTIHKNNLASGSSADIYADAANADFSLKPGSPAIGTGAPLSGVTAPGVANPAAGALEAGEPMFEYGHGVRSSSDLDTIRANLPLVSDFDYRNHIVNGGFEYGTLEGWDGDGAVAYGNAWHLQNANAGAGFYAAELNPGESLAQVVTGLKPGASYQYSLSLRRNGSSTQAAKLVVKDAVDGSQLAAWELASSQLPTTWNLANGATAGRVAINFVSGANPISVSIENTGAAGGLLIDDVGLAMVMADEAISFEMKVNGKAVDFSKASIEMTMTTNPTNANAFPRTKAFPGPDGTILIYMPAASTNWSWSVSYPRTDGASGTAAINTANPSSFVINVGDLVGEPYPYITISGPDTVYSGAGVTATYTVSAVDMEPLSGIDFSITVDGNYLSSKEFEILNGFARVSAANYGTELFWKNDGDMWTGKVILFNPVPGGISGSFDIMKLTFTATQGKLGATDVTLNYVITSYAGESIDTVIEDGVVTTSFERWYSPYDLNKDGVVDLNDVTWALQYMLVKEGEPDWAIAKAADFCENGVIDIDDLVLILANYTIPYYS